MRRFVLGTAGHVDHGKTTLVRALTGIDTDRLPEEKRRGITIELGFAHLLLGDDLDVSIVDVPGHRRLVHAMIAGASGIEVVLLVVAADEGVMPQTREHLAACELLGIRRAVVALTKIDRADPDLVEVAAEEVRDLLRGRFEHVVVPCSAKTGAGIDALKQAIAEALAALPAPDQATAAHLSIDRIFSVKGAGTVVTGTLVRGALRVGDRVRILGEKGAREVDVRGLEVHGRALEEASAPTRLAVNLASVAVADVHRGDVVTLDASASPTTTFDAEVTLLLEPKSTAALEIYVGTARSAGVLRRFPTPATDDAAVDVEGATAPPNRVYARVKLDHDLPIAAGDRFVLRMGSTKGPAGAVVGGGVVLDAHPPPARDRARRASTLAAIATDDLSGMARGLVVERAPRPIAALEIQARLGARAAPTLRALDKLADRGEVVRLKEDGFVDRAAVTALAARARALTLEHHEAHPLDRGIPLETLRKRLGERAGAAVAAEAIRTAARKSGEGTPLVVQGDVARLADFVEGGRQGSGPLDVARRALEGAALKGLGEHAVTELLGAPAKEVRAVLAKLVRDGVAVSAGDQWFDRVAIDALRARVLAHFEASEVLTIGVFKDLSGLGRKQAIPLLELFDREGATQRKGDDRVAGPRASVLGGA